jgi:16S rRNA (cytosine1402-N4)-methyltransferase
MRTRRQRSSSDPMSLMGHRSVLLHECLEQLALAPDDVVVDATLGGAGHAKEIVKLLGPKGIFLGIDADKDAIDRAKEALHDASATVHLEQGNFKDLESYLGKHVIPEISKALFDLGWSGYQLNVGRGFSFQNDEKLLMTYADSPSGTDLTAEMVVNMWGEESLADVIYGWGEERNSRKIARAIVEARKREPIKTSRQLAEIIAQAVPRRGRVHPATQTFQALRIAVNDEMGALKKGLETAWKHLKPGGRIAVISFHSVEDREVKRIMREWVARKEGAALTKSPIRPSREELKLNTRARSAKLRIVSKY